MHKLRHVLVLVLLSGLCATGLSGPARAVPPIEPPGLAKDKPCKPLPVCTEGHDYALDLERRILDNLWDGQIYEVDYFTADRPLGRENIRSVNHFGDSALWTGTYLASQSFRYALAKKYLSKTKGPHALTDEERAFWDAQRLDAQSRVLQMLDKYHVLINISQYWKHAFDPRIGPTYTGFGGGVFNGRLPDEPGYLMRACVPASYMKDHPNWIWTNAGPDTKEGMPAPYTNNRRVFGPLPWPEGPIESWYCEDGTSRDAYAGATFGLITAFDLVSKDFATRDPLTEKPSVRERLRDDIFTLVNFAVKHYWNTPRPHGRISLPVPEDNHDGDPCAQWRAATGLDTCGHDFENFASVLFTYVPMARLNMAQIARHVAEEAGSLADIAKWEAVWAEELATQLPVVAFSEEVNATDPHNSYYKYNLEFLTGFNVTRLENNDVVRQEIKRAIGVLDATVGDDINAHFETLTYALTGDKGKLADAVQHLHEWRDYRARVDGVASTDHRPKCLDGTLSCRPKARYDAVQPTPLGEVTFEMPTENTVSPVDCSNEDQVGRCRATEPLPIVDRPEADFLWQKESMKLEGREDLEHQAPGIDYLLPYWMLRYYTEADEPAIAPLPVWPGPRFK